MANENEDTPPNPAPVNPPATSLDLVKLDPTIKRLEAALARAEKLGNKPAPEPAPAAPATPAIPAVPAPVQSKGVLHDIATMLGFKD